MKLKLLKTAVVGEISVVEGSIIDIDDATAKTLIDNKDAQTYDEAAENQEIKTKVLEDKNMTIEVGKEVVTNKEPTFKSMGEFLGCVIKADKDGKVDERLVQKSTGQSEGVPADGGYTVTTDLANFITMQAAQTAVIAPKCSKMEIGPLYTGIKIPQVNESARSATTLFGGVRIYGPAEGVAKTAFKQAYTQKQVDLKKMCAVNYLTDELMQDNTALEGFIRMNVGSAFAWAIDNEIINATLSAYTAIVNHAATAEVTFAGNSPTAAEVASMYVANCNRNRAEWYISTEQYAALLALNSTGVLPLVQPNYNVSPSGTLMGRPINIIEQAGNYTDESSFMFADFSQYLLIGKGGIAEATSIHVKFLEDETAFRWTMRTGGAPLLASTITLPDGSIVSPIVTRD